MSPDVIIQLTERSKSLRKFCIHVEKAEDYKWQSWKKECKEESLIMSTIILNLNVDWKFHIIYPYKHPYDFLTKNHLT